MSLYTLPKNSAVNLYYESTATTPVATPENTLHVYQLNNPGGGVDAYTKSQSDAKYVKYDNAGATQFINGPLNIATETITPQLHMDSATFDTTITATPSTSDRTHNIPATAGNTQFIMGNPTTAQTIQTNLTTPQTFITGTGVDIYGTTALTGRHTTIKQNLNDTANAAPTLKIPGITNAGATTCEMIITDPSHDQAINANISTKGLTANGVMAIDYSSVTSTGYASALVIQGFGFGKGWACTMVPSFGPETNGTEYYRFMNQTGTITRGVFVYRVDTAPEPDIQVVAYKGAWESQLNTNYCNEIVTTISAPTNRQVATALATQSLINTGLAAKIDTANITTTINAGSTNTQVPGALAMKNYVDTQVSGIVSEADIVTDFTGTLTNTQVPGALANKNYIDQQSLPYTIPADINLGTIVYHNPTNAVCSQKYAFKYNFNGTALDFRYQTFSYIVNIADNAFITFDVDWISGPLDMSTSFPGRLRAYYRKPAGTVTSTSSIDANPYFIQYTNLPYVTFEATPVDGNQTHFKFWSHNGINTVGSMNIVFTLRVSTL